MNNMKKQKVQQTDRITSEKEKLRQAYLAINKDKGQQESMVEWENTISDGSDEW